MSKEKILAEGWYGIIIQPPLQCMKELENEFFTDKYIGKIGTLKELQKEYDFILEYLKLNTVYSKYVKKNDLVLCKLDVSKIKDKYLKDTILEDKKEYQFIMPFLANGLTLDQSLEKYKNICNKKSKGKIISIQAYKNFIPLFEKLYHEIVFLNQRKIYHNDIKMNNVLFVEKENEFLLIDYNTSITNKIPNEYANNIKYYSSFYDLYCFCTLLLFPFLQTAFTNKHIFDSPLLQFYEECTQYMKIKVMNDMNGVYAIDEKDILQNIKKYIETFFKLSYNLESKLDEDMIENENPQFCIKKYELTVKEQREKASVWNKTKQNIKNETEYMTREDVRKSLKKSKSPENRRTRSKSKSPESKNSKSRSQSRSKSK